MRSPEKNWRRSDARRQSIREEISICLISPRTPIRFWPSIRAGVRELEPNHPARARPRRSDTLSFCDEGQLALRSAWGPFHSAAGLPRPSPGIQPGDRPRPCASRGAAQGAAARASGHQSRPAVNPSDPRPGPGRTTPHGLVILPHRSRTAPRRRGAACKRPCRASLTWRVRLPATAQGGRYAFSRTR